MLDELDITLLDFERGWANSTGPKDRIIESTLGLTAEAYYSRLLELLSDRHARAYDPLTLLRLRRLIDPMARTEVSA